MGAALPLACQDSANTKAAYRFLSNERFGEDAILAGHFQATACRFGATAGLVLVVQDITEFSCRRAKPETIGAIGRAPIGRDHNGNPQTYTQCGLLMHTSLVVTPEGLPLGSGAAGGWHCREAGERGRQIHRPVPHAGSAKQRQHLSRAPAARRSAVELG